MEKMIYSIVFLTNRPEKLHSILTGLKGIAGADLYSVSFSEIAAVVCDINKADLITNQLTAIEYAAVIETLSQQFTLIPMRFGSVMESTEFIKKMVERNYLEIHQNLQKVDNKVEFGLKIFCDSDKLKAELLAKSESGITIPSDPSVELKNSIYKDYVNKKLKEHRLEELLVTYVNLVISEITGQLDRLKTISKIKKMVTPTTIIDGVFLLDKALKDELIQGVGDLQNKFPGLNFILTGPWPPYNFVDFTVK